MENLLGVVAALGVVAILMALAGVMLRHSHKWLSKVMPKSDSALQVAAIVALPGGQQAVILRYHQLEWLVVIGRSQIEVMPVNNLSMAGK